LLDIQLNGTPAELHSWRAKNAKKIPLLEELRRHHMVDGHTHAAVTFWGLLNVRGDRTALLLTHVERVFRALRKFYPDHPTESLTIDELAKRVRLSQKETSNAAGFLSLSPVYLSITSHEETTRITPNEQYVTLKGFNDLKERTRELFRRPMEPQIFPANELAVERELLRALDIAESDVVRDAWRKVQHRTRQDPEGAITAARSLVEAGCKYVLEEFEDAAETGLELPRLYRRAAGHLHLDSQTEIDESLRKVLGACATVVDGVAHLRNRLSDAHGKDRRSAKPAKRHAEFVVLIAAAMTGLLLSTLDAQRTL
jgi:hypothetical protein